MNKIFLDKVNDDLRSFFPGLFKMESDGEIKEYSFTDESMNEKMGCSMKVSFVNKVNGGNTMHFTMSKYTGSEYELTLKISDSGETSGCFTIPGHLAGELISEWSSMQFFKHNIDVGYYSMLSMDFILLDRVAIMRKQTLKDILKK